MDTAWIDVSRAKLLESYRVLSLWEDIVVLCRIQMFMLGLSTKRRHAFSSTPASNKCKYRNISLTPFGHNTMRYLCLH